MPTSPALHLAIRLSPSNANHHIWNNNGIWWFHFTLRTALGNSQRVRRSLKTADIEKARASRDRILTALIQASGRLAA